MRAFLATVVAFTLLPMSIAGVLLVVVGFGGALIALIGSAVSPLFLAMWWRALLLGVLGLAMLWSKARLVAWIASSKPARRRLPNAPR